MPAPGRVARQSAKAPTHKPGLTGVTFRRPSERSGARMVTRTRGWRPAPEDANVRIAEVAGGC